MTIKGLRFTITKINTATVEAMGLFDWLRKKQAAVSTNDIEPPISPREVAQLPISVVQRDPRQSLLRVLSADANGINFHCEFRLPDPAPGSEPATFRQEIAVEKFYGQKPSVPTFNQCHALLCWRDYARAVTARCLADTDWRIAQQFTLFAAAYIASQPALGQSVVDLMDRLHREDEDDLESLVSHTPQYIEVVTWIDAAMKDASDQLAAAGHL